MRLQPQACVVALPVPDPLAENQKYEAEASAGELSVSTERATGIAVLVQGVSLAVSISHQLPWASGGEVRVAKGLFPQIFLSHF